LREEYKHLAPLMRKEEYMAAILAELCKLNDNIEKLVKSNEPKPKTTRKTQSTTQAKKKAEKTKTEQKEAVAKKSTTTRKNTPKKKDEV